MTHELTALARFPQGRFKEGDQVRLRHPEGHNLFDNPRGVLRVAAVNWFRTHEPPIYAVQEPGRIAVTPFGDDDLCPAEAADSAQGPAVLGADRAAVEQFLLSLFTGEGLARCLRDEHYARAAKLVTQLQGRLPEHLWAWRELMEGLDQPECQRA